MDKALHPETGLPLKRGDKRSDGYVFRNLDKRTLRRDGTYQQIWLSPETVKRQQALSEAKNKIYFERKRQWLANYKLERGCVDCGYKANAVALQLDHLPQFKKSAEIANLRYGNRQRLLDELAKCEVVCSNCHAIRTHRRKTQS